MWESKKQRGPIFDGYDLSGGGQKTKGYTPINVAMYIYILYICIYSYLQGADPTSQPSKEIT